MRLEQRGRVKRLHLEFNWRQEEALECNEIVYDLETRDDRSLCLMGAV